MPSHLTNNVHILSKDANRTYYPFLTGGILSIRPKHFVVANGFSNKYYGWGAEDDDFTIRMISNKQCVFRSFYDIKQKKSPFTMLPHKASRAPNSKKTRLNIIENSLENIQMDGLNNIRRVTILKKVTNYKTFTHLLVSVKPEIDY